MLVKISARQSLSVVLLLIVSTASAFAQNGVITGTVRLTGAPPPNRPISMAADPNCMNINAGKRVLLDVVVRSSDGGLANALVSLQGSFPQAHPGSGSVTLEQKGCVYHPRILGAQVGQTLIIKNDDSTLHNVHSVGDKYNFNQSQPTAGLTFDVPLKSEEVMLQVKCNVHPWMSGYIGVVSHPYFGVSDSEGKFRIENVPPGKQTIQVWHELFGPLTQTVEVKPGATTEVEFSYSGSERRSLSQVNPTHEIIVAPGTTQVSLVRSGNRSRGQAEK